MQTKTFEPGEIVRLVNPEHRDQRYGWFKYKNPVGSRAEVFKPRSYYMEAGDSTWIYVKWIDNPAKMTDGGYYRDDFVRCVDEDTFEKDGIE